MFSRLIAKYGRLPFAWAATLLVSLGVGLATAAPMHDPGYLQAHWMFVGRQALWLAVFGVFYLLAATRLRLAVRSWLGWVHWALMSLGAVLADAPLVLLNLMHVRSRGLILSLGSAGQLAVLASLAVFLAVLVDAIWRRLRAGSA